MPPPVWTPRSDSALFAAKSAKGGDEQYAVLFGKDREDGKRLEEEVLSASSDEWAAAFGTLNLEHDDVTEIVQRRGNAVYWSLTGHNSAGAITGCLHE